VCARHPRFQALSPDAQSVYVILMVMGRHVLRTMAEETPTMRAPRLAAALDELYAADLLRSEEGRVFIDDLRNHNG
jgi:hypothetical protein